MHQAKILIEEIGRKKVLCGLCSVLGVTSTPEGLLRFAGTYIVSVFNLLPRLERFTSSEVVGKQEAGAATFVLPVVMVLTMLGTNPGLCMREARVLPGSCGRHLLSSALCTISWDKGCS